MNSPSHIALVVATVSPWFAENGKRRTRYGLNSDWFDADVVASAKGVAVWAWLLLAVALPGVAKAQVSTGTELATLEARSLQMIETGTPERAFRAVAMIVEGKRSELRLNLARLDEAGRMEFLRQLRPYDVAASIGVGRAVAQAALSAKGVVLESLIEDERAARLLGREVASLLPDERTFTWRFFKITVDDVLAKLPGDMALVELVRYRRHFKGGQSAEWYGAAILRRYQAPVFVPATRSAAEIDTAVRAYREAIEAVAGGVRDDQSLERGGRALHDWLAAGWYPHLTGARQVVICPDAALNFLPFATLLDGNGNFMAGKFAIYYATSGRDLVAREPADVSAGPAVIFADPEFGGSDAPNSVGGGSPAGLGSLQFGSLPGTKTEAEKVVRILLETRKEKQPPTIRRGKDATETALRELQSPEILHLATHGFFLEQAEGGGMSRSGLALSGAQESVESYRRGDSLDPRQDGILLAEEGGQLDLRATELVTLSACRTAVGQAEPGEGVMGLRRALVQAGARNVLMTLWDIADEPTAELMEAFYRRYDATGNAPLALSEVQRDSLQRLRKDEGLAVAVYLAGAFVLSAQATRKADLEQKLNEDAGGKSARIAVVVREEAERKAARAREEAERKATMAFYKAQEFSNTLGMTFITVDGTLVLWCEHETRVSDYAAFAAENSDTSMGWKDFEYKGHKQTPDHPVINVTWGDAVAFCAWLSQKEGRTYRLPTDHEWSIAVGIAGQEDATLSPQVKNNIRVPGYPWGQAWPPPAGYGNISGSESAASQSKIVRDEATQRRYAVGYTDQHPFTAPVKSYQSTNGLFDLFGNVKEWCHDWYDPEQSERIMRGGCWYDDLDTTLRSSFRYHITPSYRNTGVGFRVVCELTPMETGK